MRSFKAGESVRQRQGVRNQVSHQILMTIEKGDHCVPFGSRRSIRSAYLLVHADQ